MDLALFTKKCRTSGMDGARFSFSRKRRNLMPVTQLCLWHNEAVPQRALNEEGAVLLRQLANLLLENLRLQLEHLRILNRIGCRKQGFS